MPNGQVTHAKQDGVHVLRYVGRVDYMSAPAIQRFLDELMQQSPFSGLIFDLTRAEALDSTNLGLLARVNERVCAAGGAESMIVSPSEDINDVLCSMGFDQSFDIIRGERQESGAPDAPIDVSTPSAHELRHTMLEAHRALVRLSELGRVQFQDVVACLECASEPLETSDGAGRPRPGSSREST
jgi:anti-anti-sigma factor